MIRKCDVPDGFLHPTALPSTDEQARQWQEANRSWWESQPMRYDWKEDVGHQERTAEWYAEIDRRFFSAAREFMPWKKTPFEQVIPFAELSDKDVLEIGVGNGSHAGLLSRYARTFTGIDLTDYAVASTKQRLEAQGLKGTVIRMDAERMDFPDESFDFIWSWGVIHHSSNTQSVLREMRRVLRPGGQAVTMVYHRNSAYYYLHCGLIRGVLLGHLFKKRSLHEITQRWTDGALARHYTASEWRELVEPFLNVDEIRVYGGKAEVVPLPVGSLKRLVTGLVPDAAARLITNRCRLGYFLVSRLSKPANS